MKKNILIYSLVFLVVFSARVTAQLPEVSADKIKKIEEALPDKAPAKPKKARKVLLFSKTSGFRHGSIPVGVKSLTMLGKKTGAYTAVHTEDDSIFAPEKLAEFDLVIMVNTTGQLFSSSSATKRQNRT